MSSEAVQRANSLLSHLRRYASQRRRGTYRGMSRACASALEMGDGDDVVRIVIARAAKSEATRKVVVDSGHGYWLEPGYMEEHA